MNRRRIITGLLTKKRQDYIDLCVDTQKPKRRIYEHPLDLIHAKNRDVKDRVNENGKTTVHVKKTECRATAGIGHKKARQAKHQHVYQEKRIDAVPGNTAALAVDSAVNLDV